MPAGETWFSGDGAWGVGWELGKHWWREDGRGGTEEVVNWAFAIWGVSTGGIGGRGDKRGGVTCGFGSWVGRMVVSG